MTGEEYFRQIYDMTYKRTAAFVIARSRQSEDAADLIQEVYLELYRIIQKRGNAYISNPEAMVRKLTNQTMARYYRSLSRRMEVYAEPSGDDITAEIGDIEALSVEEITVDNSVIEWTEQYLASRGSDIRKIFHLYYRFGMKISEIAEYLGKTESDVKNKLYRTLKEIRAYWKGDES